MRGGAGGRGGACVRGGAGWRGGACEEWGGERVREESPYALGALYTAVC